MGKFNDYKEANLLPYSLLIISNGQLPQKYYDKVLL